MLESSIRTNPRPARISPRVVAPRAPSLRGDVVRQYGLVEVRCVAPTLSTRKRLVVGRVQGITSGIRELRWAGSVQESRAQPVERPLDRTEASPRVVHRTICLVLEHFHDLREEVVSLL